MRDVAEKIDIDRAAEIWMEIACKNANPNSLITNPFYGQSSSFLFPLNAIASDILVDDWE